MANTTQNLSKAIQGLWRDRSNDQSVLPKALAFAPINPMLGNGQYQIIRDDSRLDDRNPKMGAVAGENAQYPIGEFGYNTVDVQTERHFTEGFIISQASIDAIEGENGYVRVADDAMDFVSNQILDKYTGEFLTAAAAGLSAPSAGGLDLSSASTDLVAYFNSVMLELTKAGGKRPTHVLMGDEAFLALRNNDQVQGSTSLGGAASGGSFRRTGYAPLSAVEEFFRTAFGLEILVDQRTKIDSSGNGAFAISTQMLVGYAGDPRRGCMTTFARSADLIEYDVRPLSFPDPEGIGVAANAWYKVEVTDANKGRIITCTLP